MFDELYKISSVEITKLQTGVRLVAGVMQYSTVSHRLAESAKGSYPFDAFDLTLYSILNKLIKPL